MNRSTIALALLLACILIATPASANGRRGRGKVCFIKSKRCCYEYSHCGFEVKRRHSKVDCSHKVCKDVCRKKCTHVEKKELRRSCNKKRVGHGRHCYYERGHKVCKRRPQYKNYCRSHYVTVRKPHCRRVCHKDCKVVHAYCRRTAILHYSKLCPVVKCGKLTGGARKPPVKVGKRGKVVKYVNGPRIRRRH